MVMPTIAKPKDLRLFAVIPIRALRDPRLKPQTFRVLAAFCSYADRTGRTWVSLERVGKDIGLGKTGVCLHVRKLKDYGYLKPAKRINRHIKSACRRIVYTPNMSEDSIRSRLSARDQMELAESEAVLNEQFSLSKGWNTQADQEREALKARFVMLCERFFADARLEGWWIEAKQAEWAPHQLAEQAIDLFRPDRNSAESHGEPR
jgi:hypothetical protein